MSELNVNFLGQVFTESVTVQQMLLLRKNSGSVLEPSCGRGAFSSVIPNCISIEYDSSICPKNALNIDFFDYSLVNKFNTIIGNPPYVKFKNITIDTKKKLNMTLFDERSNLYLFFIEKCIHHLKSHGELIFIVPRDFMKATAAKKLNKFIYESGTITDWVDLGDQLIFPGFSPNCVIFRFEKDNFSRITNKELHFIESDGQLLFLKNRPKYKFSDYFFVKVGAVSGADRYFESDNGNQEFVYSKTVENGKLKKMHYNVLHDDLLVNKDFLMQRRIKKFTEKDWYQWGRGFYQSDLPRIYVNSKTRKNNPFFMNDCTAYDGSVLAIFPKFHVTDKQHLSKICNFLNGLDWENLGFKCDGRYLFNQNALENTVLDEKID